MDEEREEAIQMISSKDSQSIVEETKSAPVRDELASAMSIPESINEQQDEESKQTAEMSTKVEAPKMKLPSPPAKKPTVISSQQLQSTTTASAAAAAS